MRCRGIAVILAGFVAIAACGAGAAAGPAEFRDHGYRQSAHRRRYGPLVFSCRAADGHFDAAALDAAIKRLYATGLFKDVKIARDGDRVLVMVVENPTIGVVAFEGNKKIKDDDLKKDAAIEGQRPAVARIRPKRRRAHARSLSPARLFRRAYRAENDRAKTGDSSRVNLVFEIKEGEKLAVRQIAFAGNTAFSTTKLKAVVKTGVTNVVELSSSTTTSTTPTGSRTTAISCRRFYLDHGYADMRVSAVGELRRGDRKASW